MADRKLKIDIRRRKILEELRRNGKVSVTELSQLLNATTVTIRNDLSCMEREGFLLRIQGGAIRNPDGEPSTGPNVAQIVHAEEKFRIAEAASSMIKDGDVVFINSGTTSACVAEALKKRKNLNVVTNSNAVVESLCGVPSTRVLLLGGVINSRYGFTYGIDAQEQLERYQADWAVISVDGISAQGGVTTYHPEEAIIDKMMIRGARKTLIVADHTKIGRAGFSRVCNCTEQLHLLTDKECQEEALVQLTQCGVTISLK